MLGIPTVRDRVCQQALLNRLEPIFEPVFDEANFDIDEGARRRTRCARCGRRSRADGSGSWTPI